MASFFNERTIEKSDTALGCIGLLTRLLLLQNTDKGRRSCLICKDHTFSKKTSTSVIEQHFITKHAGDERVNAYTSKRPSLETVKRANKITVDPHVDTSIHRLADNLTNISVLGGLDSLTLNQVTAVVFSMKGLAFSLIDDPMFRYFLNRFASKCEDDTLPSRGSLAIDCVDTAKQLKTDLCVLLKDQDVAVAFDGRKNMRSVKVFAMSVILNGTSYYWTSCFNNYERSTASELFEFVKTEMDDLLGIGARVTSFAADNESTMNLLVSKLQEEYPWLVHLPCAAHTIQLCVEKILESPGIEDVYHEAMELISHYDHVEGRTAVSRVQQSVPNMPLNPIIKPHEVRWNDKFIALERLLSLDTVIKLIDNTQSPNFWSALQMLCDFLRPFYIATNDLQADAATVNLVGSHFTKLITHIQESNNTKPFLNIDEFEQLRIMFTEWDTHFNKRLIVAASFLGFDETKCDVEYISTWGSVYLKRFHFKDATTDDLSSVLKLQIGQFLAKSGSFVGIDVMIQRQRGICEKKKISFDAQAIWGVYQLSARELSLVSIAILRMNPTSSSVERIHAAESFIHSKRRNRLRDVYIHSQTSIKCNYVKINTNIL